MGEGEQSINSPPGFSLESYGVIMKNNP